MCTLEEEVKEEGKGIGDLRWCDETRAHPTGTSLILHLMPAAAATTADSDTAAADSFVLALVLICCKVSSKVTHPTLSGGFDRQVRSRLTES